MNAKLDHIICFAEKISTNSNCGHNNMIGIDEAAEMIKAIHFPLNTVEELNNLNSILVGVEVKIKIGKSYQHKVFNYHFLYSTFIFTMYCLDSKFYILLWHKYQ